MTPLDSVDPETQVETAYEANLRRHAEWFEGLSEEEQQAELLEDEALVFENSARLGLTDAEGAEQAALRYEEADWLRRSALTKSARIRPRRLPLVMRRGPVRRGPRRSSTRRVVRHAAHGPPGRSTDDDPHELARARAVAA